MPRRALIVLVTVVAVVGQAGCSGDWPPPSTAAPPPPATSAPSTSVLAAVARPVPGAVPAGGRAPVVTSDTAAGQGIGQGTGLGTGGGAVALTFDADLTPAMRQRLRDGEVDSYANMAVVDILEATGTPATFFLTGLWMEEYPAETRELVADSRFELATHSQTHRGFTTGCYGLGLVPPTQLADEVERPIRTLEGFTDRATRYFRFPGLCHDDAALAALGPLGVTVVDGDSSGDAGGRSVDAIVDRTLRTARPGSIIILHVNGGDAAPLTDEALPGILDGLRVRGLWPVTLSELLATAPSPSPLP